MTATENVHKFHVFYNPLAVQSLRRLSIGALKPASDVRISAFDSLVTSAKLNANILVESMVDTIYALISSDETAPELRSTAAADYGALNLPSQKVKDLILDQAKS